MHPTEPDDEVAARHGLDVPPGKALGEDRARLDIRGVVEGRHQHAAIRDVEVGVAGGTADTVDHDRPRHRKLAHLEAAALMGVDTEGVRKEDAGNVLAEAVSALMKRTGMPNGLSAVGYTEQDADSLVEGTLPQHRITNLCPRPFTPDDLKQLFVDSMTIW